MLKFPTAQAMYDDLTFALDGNALPVTNRDGASIGRIKVALEDRSACSGV